MTLDEFYTYFYAIYGIAAFSAVLFAVHTDLRRGVGNRSLTLFVVFVFAFLLFLLFGNRTIGIGTDTGLYIYAYNNYLKNLDNRDPFINLLVRFLHNFTDAQGYLAFYAALYLTNIFFFIKNRNSTANKFLLFFLLISMFFFKTMGINVVRQGVSLMFFLNAVNAYEQKKSKSMAFFLLGCVLFHTTGIIAIAIFIGAAFLHRRKNYTLPFVFFFLAAAVSFLKVNVFALLPDKIGVDALDVRSGYYSGDDFGYEIGFRPSFFLYNMIFLLIGIYGRKYTAKRGMLEDNNRLGLYLNYYLLCSAVFFLAFQLPFSDRWGLFSWIVIPLLFEPFLIKKGKHFALLTVITAVSLFFIFETVFK